MWRRHKERSSKVTMFSSNMESSAAKRSTIQAVILRLSLVCLTVVGNIFCHGPASPIDESVLVKFKSCLADTKVDVSDPSNETWWYDSQSVFVRILQHPIAIAYAESTSQVQELVKCATQHNVKINPRSGGHSYEAFANQDHHLVIDLSRLYSVKVNEEDETATVGAGIRLGRLYHALSKHRMAFPGGLHPTVAVAGHVAAGGYGYLGRKWGVSADNVVELEVVDYRGEILVANNHTNEDLYFALRGGGGGSYGIVTSMKLQVHPFPTLTTAFTIYWKHHIPASELCRTLFKWRPWDSMPNEMNFLLFYSQTSAFAGFYLKEDGHVGLEKILNDSGLLQLAPEESLTFKYYETDDMMEARAWLDNGNVHYGNDTDFQPYNAPTSFIFKPLDLPPYPTVVHPTWAQIQNDSRVNATHPNGSVGTLGFLPDREPARLNREYNKHTSLVFDKEFDEAAYRAVDEFIGHDGTTMVFMPYGGINYKTPEDFNGYPHRNQFFWIEFITPFYPAGTRVPCGLAGQKNISDTVLTAMEPYTNHRAYQGSPDKLWTTDPKIYMPRYYGNNAERLVRAKATYDPRDIFSYDQSTPLAM